MALDKLKVLCALAKNYCLHIRFSHTVVMMKWSKASLDSQISPGLLGGGGGEGGMVTHYWCNEVKEQFDVLYISFTKKNC